MIRLPPLPTLPKVTPCQLRMCGLAVPPRRVKAYLHVSACGLFLFDVVAGLLLAYYVPHALVGLAGSGSKLGALFESASMFIEDSPHA